MRGVQRTDNVMAKNQRYSLQDMLDSNPMVDYFVGGTVYQAFLSAISFHRWHTPVSGTILIFRNILGTYYSQNFYQGLFGGHADAAAPNNSQPYIASVATRMLIFIKADNPAIGVVAFLAIGMAEVSSCEATVAPGQHVKKGDELGMFHFGGSSYVLIFRPGLELLWCGLPTAYPGPTNYHVNSVLAVVNS